MGFHRLHLQRLGEESVSGRATYLLHIGELAKCPAGLALASPRFLCLLAADFARPGAEEIKAFAARLIDAGCVYFAVWGHDCARAHELVDELIAQREAESGSALPIACLCQLEETLEEAVAAVMLSARPDSLYAAECRSVVLAVVGGPARLSQVRRIADDVIRAH
jgi:hypothetical protein